MFFKTKRDRCKTKRQTLHTEQLEPKAMFSVSPVEPVVALDVGPVNQASVEDCMIVHPQYNLGGSADPSGDDVFMPKPNRGASLHDSVHCLVGGVGKAPFTTGAGGDSVVHPDFNVGGSSDPGGDDIFMPKPNRIAGSANPGGDDVFMPKPNRIGRAYSLEAQAFLIGVNSLAQANQQPSLTNVWTNGSATSMAPRHAAFATMGR